MRNWFAIAALAAGAPEGTARITIDGEIGGSWWDDSSVASNDFMNEVKALGDLTEIVLDLNSPGGSVTDGLTIANYLRQHDARVVVNVLGQASSIASVIAAAADEVHMGLGAFMMVHQPWTVMVGNADEMRAMAKDLDTINDGILEAYVAKVGEDNRERMAELVKGPDGQGTILSADHARDLGLADSMMEVQAAASTCMTTLAQALAKAAGEAQALIKPDPAEGDPQEPAADPEGFTAVKALCVAFDLKPEEVEAQAEDLAEQIVALRTAPPNSVDADSITLEYLQANCADLVKQIQDLVDVQGAVTAAGDTERERITKILKASATTGDFSNLEKLITEDWDADKAADFILAAAAAGDQIQGSHSPEGGPTAGISSSKIYARRKTASK